MHVLRCRRVLFYSQGDETAFFEFAQRIKSVRKIEGVGDSILLHVSARVSDASLRDLIALFQRYRIDMRQLAQLATPSNRRWFRDRKMFWHKRVFASPKPGRRRRSSRTGAGSLRS